MKSDNITTGKDFMSNFDTQRRLTVPNELLTSIESDIVIHGNESDILEMATLPHPRISVKSTIYTPPLSILWQRRLRTLLVVLFDVLMLVVGFYFAFYVRVNIIGAKALLSGKYFVPITLSTLRPFLFGFVGLMIVLMAFRGMYRLRIAGTIGRQFWILLNAAFTGFALYSIFEFLVRSRANLGLDDNTRAFVAFSWVAAVIVPLLGRLLLAFIFSIAYRFGIGRMRVLVVGGGRVGKIVMQHLAAFPALGYQIIGFINEHNTVQADFGRFHVLGSVDNLEQVLRDYQIGEAVIALPASKQGNIVRSIRICERNGIKYRIVPDMQEFSLARVDIEEIQGLPLFDIRRTPLEYWQRQIKRGIDVLGAALLLAIGAPIWLFVAWLIKLDSPGPAIYRQERIGRNGEPFTTFKFRSMFINADAHRNDLSPANKSGRGLFKVKNDPRRTRVGSFIRKTSIDEIPQLWNVLRGEMSLVGPRPPLPEEYARYEEWEKRRLEMSPGLTGLWQVRGRSDITFEEMVLMDIYYIENWNIIIDIQILLRTIPAVLFSRGAY